MVENPPVRVLAAVLAILLGPASGGPGAGLDGAEPADLPETIPDPSAGDWIVDRFAGNASAGPTFFQGPAREVGGLGRPGACPLPDGRVLVPFGEGLAEVDVEGTLRLVVETDLLPGTTAQVTAAVVAHDPRDGAVYIGGPGAIRRVVERADGPWTIEPFAGSPDRPGFADGPIGEAAFTRIDSIVVDGRGALFVLDANRRIRKIEGGRVSTITAAVHDGALVDGPLDRARFAMIDLGGNLCGGGDGILYLFFPIPHTRSRSR